MKRAEDDKRAEETQTQTQTLTLTLTLKVGKGLLFGGGKLLYIY